MYFPYYKIDVFRYKSKLQINSKINGLISQNWSATFNSQNLKIFESIKIKMCCYSWNWTATYCVLKHKLRGQEFSANKFLILFNKIANNFDGKTFFFFILISFKFWTAKAISKHTLNCLKMNKNPLSWRL